MSSHSFVLRLACSLLLGFFLAAAASIGWTTPIHGDYACDQAETCFQRALDALDEEPGGSKDEHITRLHAIQERFPGTIWGKRAGLVIGLLLLDDQPASAHQYLRTALRDFPLLEDYTRFWLAQAEEQMGRYGKAAKRFDSILDEEPTSVLRSHALYEASQAWAHTGACDQAQARFDEAIERAPHDPKAPAAHLVLAECLRQQGRIEAASAIMRRLWITYPAAPETDSVRQWQAEGVLETPTPEERYRRARRLMEEALYQEAILELERFLANTPADASKTDAMYDLAYALARLKRYDQARPLFQELAGREHEDAGDALVWLGRIYLRQGKGEHLRRLVEQPLASWLSAAQKAKLLVFWGVWLEDHGKFEHAITQYRRILEEVNNTGRDAAEALWRIGWIHYRKAELHDAVATFRRLLTLDPDGNLAPRALYWTARTLGRLGNRKDAHTVYETLVQEHPWTYYGHLARASLEEPSEQSRPAMNGDDASRDHTPTRWWGGETHYRKAMELMRLGQHEAAAVELERLAEAYGHNPEALVELSVLLADAGSYHAALRLGRLYLFQTEQADKSLGGVPQDVWRVTYPTGYVGAIPEQAQERVDPYLVAAIIREESLYNPRAVSRAGALGLMQLMPATARVMADQLGAGDVSRQALFDHRTNIRYGSWYLVKLLEMFDGNLIYTVASYNAGPRAVTRWIKEFGDRASDEFIELIPYRETRRYVKRVLRSYRAYHRLQSGTCQAASLDMAC